jgi:hypothetical protein
VVKEDELELACRMKNTWRVERGNGCLGEEEEDFLYRKLINSGWYYQPGLKAGSLVPVGWYYQPGLIRLATAGFDTRAFSPGWYYEP